MRERKLLLFIYIRLLGFILGVQVWDMARAGELPPSPQRLDDIVLTGTLTEHASADAPVGTRVISISPDTAQGSNNLSEILQKQSGLEVVPGLRGTAIRLQGLDSKYVLILVDGQRLSGRIGDAIDLESLATLDIEGVEIVKGAGSVLYGSDAIGGVVNIITRKPEETSVHLGLQSGSDGSRSFSSRLQLVQSTVQQSLNLEAHEQSPWYRAGSRASSLSGQRSGTVSWQREESFSKAWRLNLRAALQHQVLSGRDLMGAGALWERRNTIDRQTLSLNPSYQTTSGARLELLSQYQRYGDRYETQIASRSAPKTKELSQETIVQHTLTTTHLLGSDHLLTWGGERLEESLDSDRVGRKNVQRQRLSIFVQDEWTLNENASWMLVPGIRLDDDSQFAENTSSKLALKHVLSPDTVLRSSYGQGYRAPSFKELYLRFENQAVGYVVEGFEQLKPEKSEDVQVSVFHRLRPELSLEAEIFRKRLRNMIESVAGEARGDGLTHYSYRNIAAARTEGLDLSLVQDLDEASLRFHWQLLQTRDETRGIPLEGRAKQHLSYALSSLSLAKDWRLFHSAHWWGPRSFHRPDGSEDIASPAFRADAGVSWDCAKDWTLRLSVNNLTNTWDERTLRIRDRTYVFGINWNNSFNEENLP